MANNDGIGPGGLLVAFVAGAVTGAAMALLCAPATGEVTRGSLGQQAREGRDKAAEAARQGRRFVNRQRDTLATSFDRTREQFQPKNSEPGEQDA